MQRDAMDLTTYWEHLGAARTAKAHTVRCIPSIQSVPYLSELGVLSALINSESRYFVNNHF